MRANQLGSSWLTAALFLSMASVHVANAADPVNPVTARLELQKAIAEAEEATAKAVEAAAKAKIAADEARVKATIGTVNGQAGIQGDVTVGENALKTQTSLLLVRAADMAAKQLKSQIGTTPCEKRLVLISGANGIQLKDYQQYTMRVSLLEKALKTAEDLHEAAKQSVPRNTPLKRVAPATALGVSLEALTKLGSYFQTNYSFGPVAVVAQDEVVLSAVGRQFLRCNSLVVIPSRLPTQAPTVLTELGNLEERITKAVAAAAHAQAQGEALKAEAAGVPADNPNKKKQLLASAALFENAALALAHAVTEYGTFITGLYTADNTGKLSLTKILSEKQVYDLIAADGTMVLELNIEGSGGEYYTKKNLWTFLGGAPLHMMAGLIVNYTLIDPNPAPGKILNTNVVAVHTGFMQPDELASCASQLSSEADDWCKN